MRSALVPLCLAGPVLALPVFSPAARADAYLGVSTGIASQELVCTAGAPCDKRTAVARVVGGWQINKGLGAEVSWARTLADFSASDRVSNLAWNGRFRAQALAASATWTFNTAPIDVQLRAGIASVRGEFLSRTAGVANSKDTRARPLIGIGVKRAIAEHWKLRADVDLTDARAYTRDGHHATLTLGIERHF
jgi:hypothetical protein